MRNVELINVFDPPYEIWTSRKASNEESMDHYQKHGFFSFNVKDKLIKTITSARQAAEHLCLTAADSALENFIDAALDDSDAYHYFRSLMPKLTPPALLDYQSRYPHYNQAAVERDINHYGLSLAEGQTLFHGGTWSEGADVVVTTRPFSTAFCPQIARRSAEWQGKAYDAGRVEITVLKVTSPQTKAYLYGPDGDHGHEKEVLFAPGAILRVTSRTQICTTSAHKAGEHFSMLSKEVPVILVEAQIS
ncbi:hypothetical protein A0O30_08520 [Pseudomonas sp. LLC-1]|nr:hypothetical protein A0O30_08520 [Pseudomonas sp. LLC-1]